MQEVFERIIDQLKAESVIVDDDAGNRAVEIIEQATEEFATDTNVWNNGWIPCSERLPDVPEGTEDDDCPEFNVTIKGASRAATLRCSSDGTWFDEFGYVYPVIAWQPLPDPYQQKGE